MFKKAILLIVVCLVCLLSSCRSIRQEKQTTVSETKEVLTQRVSYKDTTLFAPKAETSAKISLNTLGFKQNLNNHLKPFKYSNSNGQAKVKIQVLHDTIYVSATCDSVALRAKIKQELSKEMITSLQNSNEVVSKTTGNLFHSILSFLLGFLLGTLVGRYLIKSK